MVFEVMIHSCALSCAAKPYAVHGKTKVYVLEESVSFYCIIFSQSPRTPVIKDCAGRTNAECQQMSLALCPYL